MWLKKLQMKFRKRAFANTVLLHCNCLIYELVESDSGDDVRKKAHKTTISHCFDVIRNRDKKGTQEIDFFRKKMIEMVLGIVQSDNPIISMRKELINLIHTDTLNRTFFLEKFADHRKELYESFNKYLGDSEIVNSDDTVSILCIWSIAQLYILRLLQHGYFEKAGKDDWFSRYSEAYSIYTEMLFEVSLKIDEKDYSPDMECITFPLAKKLVEQFQEKLIGEVIG